MEFEIDLKALKATGSMSEVEVVVGAFLFGFGITIGIILL